MAVTPLLATHRLQIFYTEQITHVHNVLVNADQIGGVWMLNSHVGSSVATATFVGQYITLMAALFGSTTNFVNWVLQQYVNGAYVEVDTGSIGSVGTNGSAAVPASEFTWVFRDASGKKVKFRMLGLALLLPAFKSGYSLLTGAYKAYVDDMLNNTSGHIGFVAGGRSATALTSFLDVVGSQNRKSRRRLGVL